MDKPNLQDQYDSIHVLLVDDNLAFAETVRKGFQTYKQHTFLLTWRESVESALAEITQNKEIDIILTDYNFPTSNGLEFCLHLSQMGRSIPIVFLTSVRDFNLAVEAMKLGVEDFLLKEDLDEAHLSRTIISIMERIRLRRHKQAVEKRLLMAENRTQAIRELVVTVCHEFNNPLAAVKISFDLLLRQVSRLLEPEIVKAFEDNFNTIDLEIKHLRDLNFEQIDFHGEEFSGT